MVCNKDEASCIQCSILGMVWMHIHWVSPASCRRFGCKLALSPLCSYGAARRGQSMSP